MNKLKIVSVLVGAVALLSATPALAASVSATAIFNGQTQFSGSQGQTTQVSIPVSANAGETVHALLTDVIGDNIAPVCQDISDFGGPQANHLVSASIVFPPNTGDYGFQVTPFYTNNDQAASALHGDVACAPSASNFAGAAYNQGNVIHVLPGGSVSGNTGSGSSLWGFTSFADFLAGIKVGLFGTSTPSTGTTGTTDICTKLNSFSSLHVGSTGTRVKTLQRFLNTQGAGLPVTGYYGTMTDGAVGDVGEANNCN